MLAQRRDPKCHRGVWLVATDLRFSFGYGPEARGPAEALLMTIAGRRGVAAELTGPGKDKLAARAGRSRAAPGQTNIQ